MKIDHIIIFRNKKPTIKTVIRKFRKERFLRINEAKDIAVKNIGCVYVDGLNLYIDGVYYGGIYCDDIARYNNNKTMVIINEFDGLSIKQCNKIIDYLLKEGHKIKELSELDMI